MGKGIQARRRNASALRTIRVSSELAGADTGSEIRADRGCGVCEDAVARARRRAQESFDGLPRHFEFRIRIPELQQFPHHLSARSRRQNLVAAFADLRRKEAE